MDVLPPEPTKGNSSEAAYGYQINASLAAGNSFNPVLFGELFTGLETLNASKGFCAAKSYLLYGLLLAIKYGQPKLPGAFACPISSKPCGPRFSTGSFASGPTSPQYR